MSDVQSAQRDVDAWLASWEKAGAGASGSAKASVSSRDAAAATEKDTPDTWTPKEREFAANREKIKGNEAFRANEVEKSIAHYTKALELKPGDAVVLANRYVPCSCNCTSVICDSARDHWCLCASLPSCYFDPLLHRVLSALLQFPSTVEGEVLRASREGCCSRDCR